MTDIEILVQPLKDFGFRVYLAKRKTHGFFTNTEGSRVVSFDRDGKLSGNYGPPSHESGTGWGMGTYLWEIKTKEQAETVLNENPPHWAGNGWKHLTSLQEYLGSYQASSKFEEVSNNATV